MATYSDKHAAERDARDLDRTTDIAPEIDDGKWIMVSAKQWRAVRDASFTVIRHLENCMEEIEALEVAE